MSKETPVTAEKLEALVRETALGYSAPDHLAADICLPPDLVWQLQADPVFAARVRAAEREMIESGEKAQLLAARESLRGIAIATAIAQDPGQSAASRIKALEYLDRVARRTTEESPAVTIRIEGIAEIEELRRTNPWAKTPEAVAAGGTKKDFEPLIIDVREERP